MGRRPNSKFPERGNWAPKIIKIDGAVRQLVFKIADELDMDAGRLLRDWITAAAHKVAKRLNLPIADKKS